MATQRMAIGSGLLLALQAKHAPTAAHCIRVAQNITAWGLYHRVPAVPLVHFEILGLLHDIGKIGIPERVLQKPEQLTREERTIMALHPRVGVEILRSAGVSPTVVASIQRLGEWYDGTNRLEQAGELPFAARLLSVADAFDAMISEQPYRPAMSLDAALGELRRLAGRQFDPRIVQSFIAVATAYDTELYRRVSERWDHFGFQDQAVQLFKHDPLVGCGNVTADQLKSVFHRRLVDHMNDGVVFIDTEGKIIEWNRAAEAFSGRSRSILCHQRWSPELIGMRDENGEPIPAERCPLSATLASHQFDIRRLSVQHRDGSRRAIQVQFMPVNDDRGVLRGAAMIFDDITRQKNLEQAVHQLHQRATQDPLTKVFNRAELNSQLPKFAELASDGTVDVSIIICDIDFFKRINDTYSHAAGDEALVAFANVLRESARSTDLVARYGGEEFVILCGDCTAQDAVEKAESIRRRLADTPLVSLRGQCLTASFGVAQVVGECSGEETLSRADAALLRAKQNGRDRVEFDDTLAAASLVPPPGPQGEVAVEIEATATSSWLNWLGGRTVTYQRHVELLVAVPQEVVLQKLGGFVGDWDAELLPGGDGERLRVRLDTRNAPQYARSGDRESTFVMSLRLQDVDYVPEDVREAAKKRTMVGATLETTTRRDRRTAAVDELMQRVFDSLNRYVLGEPITAEMRPRIRVHTRR